MDDNLGFRRLTVEVILQGVRDHRRKYLDYLKICTSDFMGDRKHLVRLRNAKSMMVDVENFFNSEWFMFLTDANPEELLKQTKEKTEAEFKKKLKWYGDKRWKPIKNEKI